MFANEVFKKFFRENKMLPDMDIFRKALYLSDCNTGDEVFMLETINGKVHVFAFNCGNMFDIRTYDEENIHSIHAVIEKRNLNLYSFDTVIMENAW